jgi:hypothetical protein
MNDFDGLEFKLKTYTPATMPFGKLVAYMAAFEKLLKDTRHVHLRRLRKGSTRLAFNIDADAQNAVDERLQALGLSIASNDGQFKSEGDRKAYQDMLHLCQEDNTDAHVYKTKAGRPVGKPLLTFHGKTVLPSPVLGPLTEPWQVDGELVWIGGRDKTKHAHVRDAEGRVWSGELSRELAIQMAPHLFKGTLRLEGDATWFRLTEGVWDLKVFNITGFSILAEETLLEVSQYLRNLKPTDWCKVENLSACLHKDRGHDELLMH